MPCVVSSQNIYAVVQGTIMRIHTTIQMKNLELLWNIPHFVVLHLLQCSTDPLEYYHHQWTLRDIIASRQKGRLHSLHIDILELPYEDVGWWLLEGQRRNIPYVKVLCIWYLCLFNHSFRNKAPSCHFQGIRSFANLENWAEIQRVCPQYHKRGAIYVSKSLEHWPRRIVCTSEIHRRL
mmetsp:Transcript_41775/g.75034  ORF Transcript_41775/g.75034 Transcript_41775/m.75034 type:complete len:179 (+) Transcript_41775:913-1449(+)